MEAKRRNFVGGNWKSNLTVAKVEDLVTKILNPVNIDTTKTDVVVAPINIHIPLV